MRAEFWFFVVGVALVATGCAWIYPPAGLIAAGAMVLVDVLAGRWGEYRMAMKDRGDE